MATIRYRVDAVYTITGVDATEASDAEAFLRAMFKAGFTVARDGLVVTVTSTHTHDATRTDWALA